LKLSKRTWFGVVLAIVVIGALIAVTGCGGGGTTTSTAGETGEKPVAGGTLNMYSGEISFIDPALAFESEGIKIANALFDPLMRYDYKTSELKPCVATSYDVNADATVFTFHLKQGTKFHNGREVVAADFKYAWERLSNPATKSNYGFLLSMIKGYEEMQAASNPATELSGVKVIDNYTLEVTCSSPFAELPYVVAFNDCAPVPKEEVEKDPKAFAAMPIGNGPFKMVEPWVAGQGVKLVRFEEYWGTKPNIDGVNFREFSDVNTAFLDFKAGTLDNTQIPTGQYAATAAEYGKSDDGYTTNPGKQTRNGVEMGTVELLMNNQDALFKNADLRRAVSLAINRQAICDTAWEGLRRPANEIIPPAIPGYVANVWPYSHYDLQAAKDMLAKAGYPNGQGLPTIKLSFNTGGDHETWMQLVQADLKAIGINTEFDTSDGPTYWGKVGKGEYQIGRSGWISDYPTMDDWLSILFFSTSGQNFDQYKSQATDDALTKARAIANTAERIKAYQAIDKTLGEECPEAPIAYYAHNCVSAARVHNLTLSPMNLFDFVSCWLAQ
jgi:oligopeptide transport system substrate-binding protein